MNRIRQYNVKYYKRAARTALFKLRLEIRRITAEKRVLPNFLIIGAQKSGTTSLFSYLTRHPDIIPPVKKEIHYFDLNFKKSIDWYKSFFPKKNEMKDGNVTGEASPQYMLFPHVMPRIKAMLPKVKLIMILRNPVTRAYSHYNHQVRMKREIRSFEEAIAMETERIKNSYDRIVSGELIKDSNFMHYSYLERGKYCYQIENVLKFFDRKNVLIVQNEKFKTNPQAQYDRILNFLGLPIFSVDFTKKYNAHKYPPMDEDTRQSLGAFFRDYNRKLYDLIGSSFDW